MMEWRNAWHGWAKERQYALGNENLYEWMKFWLLRWNWMFGYITCYVDAEEKEQARQNARI